MGELQNSMAFAGLRQGKLTQVMADGTRIVAQHDGATPIVTITSPTDTAEAPQPPPRIAAWIPRGFVVYPTSDESRTGWGGPPIPADDVGTWHSTNLRPGLDVARWTVAGPLGEVLLTRVRDAGYPRRRRNAIPAMFERVDVPRGRFIDAYGRSLPFGTATAPAPETTVWTAYRMEFEDALNRDTMEPDVLLRALFVAVRDDDAFLMPLRGYYDRAWRASSYVRTGDLDDETIVDAELPSAPAGYVKASSRARHDGEMRLQREAITRHNGTISEVADELAGAINLHGGDFEAAATTLHVADVGALRSLVAEERRQWIAYGARRWYPPTGQGLPILSWDGPPFANWHAHQVYQFTVDGEPGGATEDLESLEGPVRGELRPLYSKRLYAWGRVIGELPDTVLAAAIQQYERGWRIVVLTYRASDQPGSVWDDGFGFKPFNTIARLRLYFVDVARNEAMTMLLREARVGEYDAVSNPLGWRYADQVRLAEDDRWMVLPDFSIRTYCPLQAPVFDSTGTRVLATYDRFLAAPYTRYVVMTETVLLSIEEGAVTTERTLWGGPAEDPAFGIWTPDAPSGLHPNMIYGADYAPAGAQYRISMLYEAPAITTSTPELSATVLRHNNYTTGGDTQLPTDIVLSTFSALYSNFVYTLDVVKNVPLVLNHVASASGFQVVWVRDGSSEYGKIFTDPYGIEQIWWTPSEQRQSIRLLQPTYARRGSEWIFGVELAPHSSVWAVPPGAFIGAFYYSSLGDLDSLTQTPGARVGYYPVGVV